MCIGMANGGKTQKEVTPQGAVEELKIILPYHKGSPTEKIYKLAINALEKQIPKKPKHREGTTYTFCPCCDSNNIHEYCGDCGQKIDWSDTDEQKDR